VFRVQPTTTLRSPNPVAWRVEDMNFCLKAAMNVEISLEKMRM
jgi:hypothetical protein